ncbi:MAG: cytochrome c biogenesis protein CcsA [candidate division Zixibacteria bacterium]|nr:cytochrome c biogenesis protein CcsA [candidate division Zixibacteria bacterium]
MSLDTPGQTLIVLALIANIMAGVGFVMLARGRNSIRNITRLFYHAFTLFTVLASVWLYYLILSHRFVVKYVYEYTDSTLEFFYLISAFWGGQEGTYLLWVLLMALFGYIVMRHGGRFANWAMVIYSGINLFLLVIMVRLSPFALMDGVPLEGAGLNPLLQDPWMVIHPPIMFIGYATAAIPFAIALAALIRHDYSDWVKHVFPWVAFSGLMLAAGNILGAYWAYETLGWGGYWAWDPVENSSLIPWFVSLALIHGLILERRTGALRRTNLTLTALLFLTVLYGTFLTRSGVLSDFSVHSFVDLGTNAYLVAFILCFSILTMFLLVIRFGSMKHVPLDYNFFGRQFHLMAGMLLMLFFALMVLFWSSLPLLTQAVGVVPRAADIATYNDFALPLGIVLALMLTLTPFIRHNPLVLPSWRPKVIFTIVAAAILSTGAHLWAGEMEVVSAVVGTMVLAVLLLSALVPGLLRSLLPSLLSFVIAICVCLAMDIHKPLFVLLFATGAASVASSVVVLIPKLARNWRKAGGATVHLGFGIMIFGILGSSAFVTSERLVLIKGEPGEAFDVSVTYNGMANDITFPRNELLLTLQDGSNEYEARPQLYYTKRLNGIMKRPYIHRTLGYDLYYAPQQVTTGDENQGLYLQRDHPVTLDGMMLTFLTFDVGGHGEEGAMQVTASIEVARDNKADTIHPAVVMKMTEAGSEREFVVATLPTEEQHEVLLDQIMADEGAISVNIPGLTDVETTGELILDVSREPIINLVWGGTIILMIGAAIAFVRRRGILLS